MIYFFLILFNSLAFADSMKVASATLDLKHVDQKNLDIISIMSPPSLVYQLQIIDFSAPYNSALVYKHKITKINTAACENLTTEIYGPKNQRAFEIDKLQINKIKNSDFCMVQLKSVIKKSATRYKLLTVGQIGSKRLAFEWSTNGDEPIKVQKVEDIIKALK